MLLRDVAIVWEGRGGLGPAGCQEQGCPRDLAVPPQNI